MNELYAANSTGFKNCNRPDYIHWSGIFPAINLAVSLIDRTKYLTSPIRFKVYDEFKMPQLPKVFTKTYEEICDERVKELVTLQDKTNVKIYIPYSGGIDSTLLVVVFLKHLGADAFKERIVILLNDLSIRENPNFYYNTIRKLANFQPSDTIWDLFKNNAIIVGGEFNDQLFGSDSMKRLTQTFGDEFMLEKANYQNIYKSFLSLQVPGKTAQIWTDLMLEQIRNSSPVTVDNMYVFFWWLNFSMKWQSIFFRTLLRINSEDRTHINEQFIKTNYHHFFSTKDFQIWSMLNPNLKILKKWNTYKFHAKEIIYKFNKDSYYFEEKIKVGSLYWLFAQRHTAEAITTDYKFLTHLNFEEFIVADNSWST